MTQLRGDARMQALNAGIEQERQVREDPQRLARRTVLLWRQLEEERSAVSHSMDLNARERLEARLTSAIHELKRDPQLESLLRAHQRELGIADTSRLGWALRARTVEQALVAPTRGHSLGL